MTAGAERSILNCGKMGAPKKAVAVKIKIRAYIASVTNKHKFFSRDLKSFACQKFNNDSTFQVEVSYYFCLETSLEFCD